jgi:hypothetical protein
VVVVVESESESEDEDGWDEVVILDRMISLDMPRRGNKPCPWCRSVSECEREWWRCPRCSR